MVPVVGLSATSNAQAISSSLGLGEQALQLGALLRRFGWRVGDRLPVGVAVAVAHAALPRQPRHARPLGQQVFFLEPMALANLSAPSPTSIMWSVSVITSLATFDGVLMSRIAATAPPRRDGPCMHARVQLDHAFLVRQPAVADARVVGVQLDDVHSRDHRVERVRRPP